MDKLEPFDILPFPTDNYILYKGIAFDGCFYYMTLPENCLILQFNKDFEQRNVYDVYKSYCCICYDNTENCFWASVDNLNTVIYKLDHNLKEIDLIRINLGSRCNAVMKDISYNCEKNSLFAAFNCFLAEISKNGEVQFLQTADKGYFNGILSAAPFYMVSLFYDNSQRILLFDQDGCTIKSYHFTDLYQIEALLFSPCDKFDKSSFVINILATKHSCYPRLLKCRISNCNLNINMANYDFNCCHRTSEQYTNDLIESIALEETALSNILNELGSKLQKTIHMADNIDQLLEVNKAVNKTIMNITQLEQILYAKLETINSLNRSCHKDDNTKKQL